ncbi:MAG: efflux RND transporter periplasmic adaptor subunit [Cyclobacteriaceae bacterium]
MNRKKSLIFLAIIVVLVAIFFLMKGSRNAGGNNIIVEVQKGEFVIDVNTTGELEAKNSTEIMGPPTLRNYRIWNVNIQKIIPEGSYVKKGQFVASLDPSELTNRMKDMQIELEEKESKFIQTKLDTTLQMRESRDELINLTYGVQEKELILEQSQFEPPATIKQAEIDLEKAKRALQQAKENYLIKERQNVAIMQEVSAKRRKSKNELDGMLDLQKAFRIMAPEDGMLIYRKGYDGKAIKEGSQISAWDPVVATLPDLSSMNSNTYVNEVDIRRIATGQKVEIGLDAFPDKNLTGKVTKVANVGEQRPNSDSKVFQVTVEIDAIDGTLRPGMTTSNKIITTVFQDATFIPLEALHIFQDSITYVFLKEGLSYQKQEVLVGETNANHAQIEMGLKEGQSVYLSIPESSLDEDIVLLTELNGKRNEEESSIKLSKPTS